ncbi:MAG TPA: SUMF1/EgtB/PvdO family nonheme iron enzyme [Terriglobia bacterium]|nr:SUMF1/EgtB/PvdO family nonheme iron enzyme [Terriglobia bacterium]
MGQSIRGVAAAVCLTLLYVLAAGLPAQDTAYPPVDAQIPGPKSPADFRSWLTDIKHWRHERLIRIGYDGSEYARPELQWTQHNFVCVQMMIEERNFFDSVQGKYTVDRYLDGLKEEFGGVDSVLIWDTYPNLGIDDRNQYDRLRDMPGGVAGVKQMVADFHRRGVRVLFPETPWDEGTRDEGLPHWTAQARLMASVGADGLLGDTLDGVPRAFDVASDQIGHLLALLPEGLPSDEALAWNDMTWGYWSFPFVPMISRYKWLEHRHMPVLTSGGRHHLDGLQAAFFNGVGYADQEDVIGLHNGFTPRELEALRRMMRVERAFAGLLISSGWEPHTPTLQYGVFASRFPGEAQTLWTIINRNPYDVTGREIQVPFEAGTRYFDLWHGVELHPEFNPGPPQDAELSFDLEAHGFGAVLATRAPTAPLRDLLDRTNSGARQKLADYTDEWTYLPQHLIDIPSTEPATHAPPGMILIPGGDFDFKVQGMEIAGGDEVGVDVQYPWEDSPRRHHEHYLAIRPFYFDRFPVTNAQFKQFLDATHYHPRDDHNFLRDWRGGTYPGGWSMKPVTWVSLDDARAYAHWAGKRLPHEWEWQYAAQGRDARLYPWGNAWDDSAVPSPDKRRMLRSPDEVTAHPKGASPFGIMDLVGNVWQWTDEFEDPHTRSAVLRGGSYYQPQGSMWYFPQAYRLDQHGKYLLMAPSIDRSGTVGFRCVVDSR